MESTVGIIKTKGHKNLNSNIATVAEKGDMHLSDGDRVLIKINLCDLRYPSSGATTDPLVLDALLGYLRKKYTGLDIKIIESNATSARPDIIMKWFGFDKVTDKWNALWYNLSLHPLVEKNIDGHYFKKIEISEIFEDYDYFITLPKLKTHTFSKISVGLKNQYGCIPYERKVKYHKHLDDVIVDANLAMRPDFCLVDGIVGMGGVNGPIYGVPINANLLISGNDVVAVDTVSAEVMGFNPKSIGHIKKAEKSKIGTSKYVLQGDVNSTEEVKMNFEFPKWIEYLYRFGMHLKERAAK